MTREEAIEVYNGLINVKIREAFEFFAPELAENEDERIRKWIIEEFKLHYDFESKSLNPMVEKALAWLEKLPTNEEMLRTLRLEYEKGVADTVAKYEQREQKPTHTAKEAWKEMRLEVYAQASGNRHEPNYSDDSTKMFSLCDIDEIFEKIGNSTIGSQSVGWSEEDKLHLNNAILAAEKEWGTESFTAKWLESLPERYILQSKQEWSKEDEKMVETICKEGDLKPSEQRWLKSLPERFNLPPKREWSEEDKKRIQRIYDFLWKNRKGDTDTIYQIEKDANWLKSLLFL